MTPDLSYELEGEREHDVCAKIINGMRANTAYRSRRYQPVCAGSIPGDCSRSTLYLYVYTFNIDQPKVRLR